MVMVPAAQMAQTYVLTQGGGDRTKKQNGATALQNKGNITIFYNAELKDVSCCTKVVLCCICQKYDLERSYLYLRENSIESNIASNSLFCGEAHDYVTVTYFDRKPYKPFNMCICCCKSNPKLEITKPGCVICCIPVIPPPCCAQEEVVIMPGETVYGCCNNRVTKCDNCCELWGRRTGAPKLVYGFEPQPKNAAEFVACAQQIMSRN